jgi:hypothetical protein
VKPLFISVRRRGTIIFGAMAISTLLSAPVTAPAQPKEPTPTERVQATETRRPADAAREEWRKALRAKPLPKNRCFTATYPDKSWREVPCKAPTPHKLFLPQHGGMVRVDVVGGTGSDFAATVKGNGNISEAEGSFDTVTGVTYGNPYSLQLNTDRFQTSACSGSPNSGCRGWQQFVYESSGYAFIQYWLLGYGPSGTLCPTPRYSNCQPGFATYKGWCPVELPLFPGDPNPVQCVINAANEPSVPSEPMTSLSQLEVDGAAAGVNGATDDSINIWVGGTPHKTAGDNRFPDLGSQWQETEFNVFGDGNGSGAVLDLGADLKVRTEIVSGTSLAPSCDQTSFTAESNNTTLVPGSCSPMGAAIVFAENSYCPDPIRGTNTGCLSQVTATPSSKTFSLNGRQESSAIPPNVILTWANGHSAAFYGNPVITLSATNNPNQIAYKITFDSIYRTHLTPQLAEIRLRDINNKSIVGYTSVSPTGALPVPKCPGPYTISALQGILGAPNISSIVYVDIQIFPIDDGGSCV